MVGPLRVDTAKSAAIATSLQSRISSPWFPGERPSQDDNGEGLSDRSVRCDHRESPGYGARHVLRRPLPTTHKRVHCHGRGRYRLSSHGDVGRHWLVGDRRRRRRSLRWGIGCPVPGPGSTSEQLAQARPEEIADKILGTPRSTAHGLCGSALREPEEAGTQWAAWWT